MNYYKILNSIALSIPLILAIIGIFDNEYFTTALMSTMITGFIQVILGFAKLIENRKNKKIQNYLIAVCVFFLLWYLNTKINFVYDDYLAMALFPVPIILAIYFSIIIYKTE